MSLPIALQLLVCNATEINGTCHEDGPYHILVDLVALAAETQPVRR